MGNDVLMMFCGFIIGLCWFVDDNEVFVVLRSYWENWVDIFSLFSVILTSSYLLFWFYSLKTLNFENLLLKPQLLLLVNNSTFASIDAEIFEFKFSVKFLMLQKTTFKAYFVISTKILNFWKPIKTPFPKTTLKLN